MNVRSVFVSKLFLLVVAAAVSAGIVARYFTPWEREITVITTADAFVGPTIGLKPEVIEPGLIAFGITPAAWPAEARAISRAAERGTIVHVVVNAHNQNHTFDVVGVSPNGNLLAAVGSMSDARGTSAMLTGHQTGARSSP